MKVEIYTDYACPFCYIGHVYFNELRGQFPEIEPVWCACEAVPAPSPPYIIKDEDGWRSNMKKFMEPAGLALSPPHMPYPHSALAFQAMHFIAEHGGDVETFHLRVFAAYFEQRAPMEEIASVLRCAEGTGCDMQGLEKALEEERYAARQQECNRHAYEDVGIEVVPTFICGDKRYAAQLGVGITKEGLRDFLSSL